MLNDTICFEMQSAEGTDIQLMQNLLSAVSNGLQKYNFQRNWHTSKLQLAVNSRILLVLYFCLKSSCSGDGVCTTKAIFESVRYSSKHLTWVNLLLSDVTRTV